MEYLVAILLPAGIAACFFAAGWMLGRDTVTPRAAARILAEHRHRVRQFSSGS